MIDDYVNIIITGYRISPVISKLEGHCLRSIVQNTKYKHFVITYLDNYASGLTLTQAWNKLISESNYPYVCLLNNDTEVSPGWLDDLVAPFETIEHLGFTGPSTNNCHSIQNTVASKKEAEKYRDATPVIVENPLSGFCLLFKKEMWGKLGGFDEQYTLYGQESDFCDRAHTLGFKSAWVQKAFVYHAGESSVRISGVDVQKERQKAKNLYWSTRG